MTSPPQNGSVLVLAGGWHDERPGGANRLPTDFARFLAGRCHPVAYLCPSDLVERVTSTEADGVSLWRYPSPVAPSPSAGNVRQHVRWVRHAMRALVTERPVTTLLGHAPLQYLIAATICSLGVRRCYAVHSPFAAELRENITYRPTLKQRLSWLGARWMERRILQISDLVHCDSDYARGLMVSAYPEVLGGKAIVLSGWVDGARFRPSRIERSALRARLGVPWIGEAPTFFTLRRLVPRMGLDTLIDAAASLTRSGRVFRLIVGGEGPERHRLEALARERGIADRVAFIGRVAEDRIVDSFAAADCFVLPTRALECFGLIVLESYACGVPVIGVPVGSIPEVMGAGFKNWIADDNAAPALARRMEEFLSGRLSADPARLRARALEFERASVAQQHERALLGARDEGRSVA